MASCRPWAVEEIVRAYRSVTGREELRNANDRHDARFARWQWDDDGSLVLTARLGRAIVTTG
jgi:hypothetical protein